MSVPASDESRGDTGEELDVHKVLTECPPAPDSEKIPDQGDEGQVTETENPTSSLSSSSSSSSSCIESNANPGYFHPDSWVSARVPDQELDADDVYLHHRLKEFLQATDDANQGQEIVGPTQDSHSTPSDPLLEEQSLCEPPRREPPVQLPEQPPKQPPEQPTVESSTIETVCSLIVYRCRYCGNIFHRKGRYLSHLSTTHDPSTREERRDSRPNSCSYCGKQFTSRGNLRQHQLYKHDIPLDRATVEITSPSAYPCEYCQDEFSHESALKRHRTVRHQIPYPDPVFACSHPNCVKAFGSRSTLKRHERTVHSAASKWDCPVPHCRRKFRRRDYVVIHVQKTHRLVVPQRPGQGAGGGGGGRSAF
ncbi:uncharacterized protein BDV14DRAFT_198984 [Aspergillus stella-maris]|uniref:uncharacterized protein n=1 Tax=Aspergillus stella-maris TaxID=1810926 RepID=UPI003CCCA342